MSIIPPRLIGELEQVGPTIWRRRFMKGVLELPTGEQKEIGFFEALVPPPVIIFAITPDGLIAATRQYRIAAEKIIYELPGGNAIGEETTEQIAARELKQETGYQGKLMRLSPVPLWFLPDCLKPPFWPFLAKNCVQVQEPRPHGEEWLERVLMPLPEWMERIRNGEAPDAKSLATTLLALLELGYIKLP